LTDVYTWTAWEWLDKGRPLRIAYSVGDEGIGQRWYRYRLLGSQLQNAVIYVSPMADGSLPDERVPKEELQQGLDPDAYYSRLVDRKVDYVVLEWPPPPETTLVLSNPEGFESSFATKSRNTLVFQVRPGR
jgi:hypothetical protein